MAWYLLTAVVSFCSILYELILSQTLSALLGNTVYQYSVVLGLYLFAMGVGTISLSKLDEQETSNKLVQTEFYLAGLGCVSVPVLFLISGSFSFYWVTYVSAYLFVVAIGFLTGREIPLILNKINKPGLVFAASYIGAFIGTCVFALYLYREQGVLVASVFAAVINALVGLLLLYGANKKFAYSLGLVSVISLCALTLIYEDRVMSYLSSVYLGV